MLWSIIFTLSITAIKAHHHRDIDYFIRKSGIQKSTFRLNDAHNGHYHFTDLDDNRDLWIFWRQVMLKHITHDKANLYRMSHAHGKMQTPKKWQEFPCPLNGTKSQETPSHIQKLRPGDIDVVAAIGDSLTAGNGIMWWPSPVVVIAEFRGMSFSGGGIEDWRTILTLPNILKVFNPNLYGFASDHVLAMDRAAHLNVAEPMMLSRDLLYQVQVLIQRMKQDPLIDMQHHWKLLTIFVGTNDLCTEMCHYENMWDFLQQHEQDILEALRELKQNVPRLLVNLIPAPNMVNLIRNLRNISEFCDLAYNFACSCLMSKTYGPEYLQRAQEFIIRWQAIDEHVASRAEFHSSDFGVNYHSFMANFTIPLQTNGDLDMRYFGRDCFHFSQLGNAAMANILWNHMLETGNPRDTEFRPPFQKFECPTLEQPYLAVQGNIY
uniref:Phospholipase B1, membrane-associated n=1 Tax=Stomoxys calcitrans TaxID=35570 RepID=A0A1I8NW06_STOCA